MFWTCTCILYLMKVECEALGVRSREGLKLSLDPSEVCSTQRLTQRSVERS